MESDGRLREMIDALQSKEDLVAFIEALQRDLALRPETWENPTLERYLAAMASWLAASDPAYRNQGLPTPQTPTWKDVAILLHAAKIYE